jgi:putative transcriptional regulator
VRLKSDGRIVELRDGRELPLASDAPSFTQPASGPPAVRVLRQRSQLTQSEFAARLGVPVETIRNWEQGKRVPRGPARALLTLIAVAPESVFSALANASTRG